MSQHSKQRASGSLMKRLALAGLTLTTCVTLADTAAMAGPVGQEVVIGDVTFVQNGNQWQITASDGAVIDYISFDILPQEFVQFIQPGSDARVLNRINSDVPTQIMGTLAANGFVYFVNPAGVIFGEGAVVNTGGLIAAAGNLSNEDFTNRVDRFTNLSGDVSNGGSIAAETIYLVGQRVANAGVLSSDGGMIAMVAGDAVRLSEINGRLSIVVDGTTITNRANPIAGSLVAGGTGVANVGTIDAGRGGEVVLGAGDLAGFAVHNAGQVKAEGGRITMAAAGGIVHNAGSLDVSNDTGDAGTIVMQGPGVLNNGVANANAKHDVAGTVVLHGDQFTVLGAGSSTTAAGGNGAGKGGSIVIDTNNGASYVTSGAEIDVRGGTAGGQGGSIVLGGDGMVLNGSIKLDRGTGAQAGTFTLIGEASDVYIQDFDPDNAELYFDDWFNFVNGIPGNPDFALTLAELQQLSGEIRISTGALGEVTSGVILIQSLGSIYVVDNVTLNSDVDLDLQAINSIFIQALIEGGDDLFMTADLLDNDGVSGVISLEVPVLNATGSITLRGDMIELRGNGGDIALSAGGNITFDGETYLYTSATATAQNTIFEDVVGARYLGDGPAGQVAPSLLVNGNAQFKGDVGVGNDPSTGLDQILESVTVTGETTFGGGSDNFIRVETLDDQDYQGMVTLDANTRLVAGDDIRIEGGGIGNGNDLTLNGAGNTWIDGGWIGINSLFVDGEDTGRALIRDLIEATTIYFDDEVALFGSAVVRGLDTVFFRDAIDAFASDATLEVEAGRRASFFGDIGEKSALKALLVTVDEAGNYQDSTLIVFGEEVRSVITNGGNIELNAGDRGAGINSGVATIGVLNDGEFQLIAGSGGSILIGAREKVTALGNLELIAGDMVQFADLTVAGNLAVTAPDIQILARAAGEVSGPFGGPDGGTDIIVGGDTAFFSSTPTVVFADEGAALPRLGTFAPGFESNGDLELVEIDPFTSDQLTGFAIGEGKGEFTVYDIALAPPVIVPGPGPNPTPGPSPAPTPNQEFEGTLAEFTGREIAGLIDPIEARVLRDPLLASALRDLAVVIRELRPEELRTLPEGRLITMDTADARVLSGTLPPASRTRLGSNALLATADRIDALLGPVDAPDAEETAAAIRDGLAAAIADWRAAAPGAAPSEFAAWVRGADEHIGARFSLEALRDIDRSVSAMGLTPVEVDTALVPLLESVAPAGTTVADLMAMIRGV